MSRTTGTGRTGRPTTINHTVRHRDDGTPVTAADQIVDRVALGMGVTAAAAAAGISRDTIHKWRLKGARARATLAQGGKVTANERLYADFADRLEKAEAEAEATRLGIVHRAALGGATTTKTTTRTDATGQVTERTTVVETLRPEWTAAAWWLERRRGYVKRYEVTGAEGAPLVPQQAQARELADSLRDYLQGVNDGAHAGKAP